MTRITRIFSSNANRTALAVCLASAMVAGLATQSASADKNSGGKMLERLDTDKNGSISLSEFIAKVEMKSAKRFKKRDQNNDGFITMDERKPKNSDKRAAMRECMEQTMSADHKRPSPEEVFARMDASGDGTVDYGEFSGFAVTRATEKFMKIDADASGDATLDEIKGMRDARKSKKGDRRAAKKACKAQIKAG